MTQLLRGKTLFQKVALALRLLAVVAAIVSYCFGRTSAAESVLLALILSYIAFRNELVWRIRNRLLIPPFCLLSFPSSSSDWRWY
jgi:hypothetical protein